MLNLKLTGQDDAEEAKKMKEQLEKDWKKHEEEYNEGVRIWKAEAERRKASKGERSSAEAER